MVDSWGVMDFEAFFADHYDEVVRTLALAVGDRARAEDAAQEAFARAYLRWGHVSGLDRPVGWVVVVGTNQMRRWLGRHDRRFHAGPAVTQVSLDATEGIADAATIAAALDGLAPRQRAVVVLRHLCGLPTDEVARALGCAPGTVRSALHTALGKLRVALGTDGDPLGGDEEVTGHATR